MVIINFLDSLYSKLPRFGSDLRNFVVSILPYAVVFFGILITIAGVLDIIGTPFLSVFSSDEGAGVFRKLMLVNLIGIIQGVIMVLAFKPLRRKQNRGWRLVFWSQILWIASALITFSPSLLLGFLFFYPLFQVRDHYK